MTHEQLEQLRKTVGEQMQQLAAERRAQGCFLTDEDTELALIQAAYDLGLADARKESA